MNPVYNNVNYMEIYNARKDKRHNKWEPNPQDYV